MEPSKNTKYKTNHIILKLLSSVDVLFKTNLMAEKIMRSWDFCLKLPLLKLPLKQCLLPSSSESSAAQSTMPLQRATLLKDTFNCSVHSMYCTVYLQYSAVVYIQCTGALYHVLAPLLLGPRVSPGGSLLKVLHCLHCVCPCLQSRNIFQRAMYIVLCPLCQPR